MTKREAREEAVRRWGFGSLAVEASGSKRFIVAGPDTRSGSVKGAGNSFEAAFADATRRESEAKETQA